MVISLMKDSGDGQKRKIFSAPGLEILFTSDFQFQKQGFMKAYSEVYYISFRYLRSRVVLKDDGWYCTIVVIKYQISFSMSQRKREYNEKVHLNQSLSHKSLIRKLNLFNYLHKREKESDFTEPFISDKQDHRPPCQRW